MSIQEFEEMEKLKKHFRLQMMEEITKLMINMQFLDGDTPRNSETYESEDFGYNHGISQVQKILRHVISKE